MKVNGGELPEHVVPFCIVAAAVAACLPLAAFFLQRASVRLQLEGTQPQNLAQVWSTLQPTIYKRLPMLALRKMLTWTCAWQIESVLQGSSILSNSPMLVLQTALPPC